MAPFKGPKQSLGGGAEPLSPNCKSQLLYQVLVTQDFRVQTKHSMGTLLASLQEGQTPSNRGTETLTLSAAALMSLLPWRSWCSQLVTYMSCFLRGRGGGRVVARSKDVRTDPSQMV